MQRSVIGVKRIKRVKSARKKPFIPSFVYSTPGSPCEENRNMGLKETFQPVLRQGFGGQAGVHCWA